jgi:hypothetical protein
MSHHRSLSGGISRFPRGASQVSGSAHRMSAGGTGFSHRNFTSRPSARQFDCSARTIIARVGFFKEVQDMLGTISSPYRQKMVIRVP